MRVHRATRDLIDHLRGAHRLREPVLTRLEISRPPRPPERGAKDEQVSHDAAVHEPATDLLRARSLRNVYELLGGRVALEWLLHPSPDDAAEQAQANDDDKEEKKQEEEKFAHQYCCRRTT